MMDAQFSGLDAQPHQSTPTNETGRAEDSRILDTGKKSDVAIFSDMF